MFKQSGKKLMGISKFICWVGIIASVILAIVEFVASSSWNVGYDDRTTLIVTGVCILVFGPIISWASSLSLYCLGEIHYKISNQSLNNSATTIKATKTETEKLDALLKKGIITQEEYDSKIKS